ncbi:SdpI family protein [Chitinophaga nivalis]|uniref:SdpI family protein n=1 Tax=Chitinophaga nivalis TaxID=2991709 RepID=A0ABT3IRP8_9BACT|nr:SdpI family protein [Chitinophaga nivalis]MCW3463658.1 SdpI family protein [Chitinophaga nivalis]MCW3486652.1 SdpI family protein [Chitinophaga nivalis]
MLIRFLHSTFCNAALFAGIVFCFMGYFIRRYPPKSIKSWYGYRSFLSTRSPETWQAANQYAADISRRIGWVLIVTGLAAALFFERQTDWFYYLTVGAVITGTMYMVGYTEWQLDQHFDENQP